MWRAIYGATSSASELLWTRSDVRDASEVTKAAAAAQASLSLTGPLLRIVGMDLADGSQRLRWWFIISSLTACHGAFCSRILRRHMSRFDRARLRSRCRGASPMHPGPRDCRPILGPTSWRPSLITGSSEDRMPRFRDDDHGGVDRVADSEEVLLAFDAGLTTRLLKEAPSAYRTQVNDLLLAALARAVSRWSGIEDVVVELEGHGREDVFDGADVSRTIGWFTTAFPVWRLPGGSGDDAVLIKSVKRGASRRSPPAGLGGVLRHLGTEAQRSALAARPEPRIVFNYLGQFDSSMGESAPFRLAPESSGPMRSDSAPLAVGSASMAKSAKDNCACRSAIGRKRYRRATIERLAEHYAAALRELVAHCIGGARGVTPSDFGLSDLSQADLDALVATMDCREIEDIYLAVADAAGHAVPCSA